jgi:hypothetical protein
VRPAPLLPRKATGDGHVPTTLVIACGALARELMAVIEANRLDAMQVTCLPAILHNRPEKITEAVRAKIRANRGRFDSILCLYGDCGTGGALDVMLAEEDVERIEGAHCYEFFMGTPDFTALADAEPATFYLTDYLVRHFDRLMIRGLGLDRHPELLPVYFGNYRRVVHLAQFEDETLAEAARRAAARLGLPCERRFTGLDGLTPFLSSTAPAARA